MSEARLDLRGLVWTLVRTDFKVRYHGTFMGFLWALAKPVTMLAVLLAVFSFIFTKDRDYGVKLALALFLHDFFTEGTKVGLTSLAAKGYLVSKTRLPTWILVITSLSNAALTLLVTATAMLLYLVAGGRGLGPLELGLFAFYVLNLAVIVAGFSLGASVLFLRYRDLNQFWELIAAAGFFVAPIIWPLGIIPERYHFAFYLWPVTPVIQFSRAVLIEGDIPTFKAHLLLVGLAAATLAVGVALFRRLSPGAAERI